MIGDSIKQLDPSDLFAERHYENAMLLIRETNLDTINFINENQNIEFLVWKIMDGVNVDDYIGNLAYLVTCSDSLNSIYLTKSDFINRLFDLAISAGSAKVFFQVLLIFKKILTNIQIQTDTFSFHFGFYSLIMQIIPEISDVKILSQIILPILKRYLKCYPFLVNRIFVDVDIILLIRNCLMENFGNTDIGFSFSLLKTLISLMPDDYMPILVSMFLDLSDIYSSNQYNVEIKLLKCFGKLIMRSNDLEIPFFDAFLSLYRDQDSEYMEQFSKILLILLNKKFIVLNNQITECTMKIINIYSTLLENIMTENLTQYLISLKIIFKLIPIYANDHFELFQNFISNSKQKSFHDKKIKCKFICLMVLHANNFVQFNIYDIYDILMANHYSSKIVFTLHYMMQREDYRPLIKVDDLIEIISTIIHSLSENDALLMDEMLNILNPDTEIQQT